jgi:hypothetical protein
MSRLNIWITDLGNPCRMAQRDWVVAVSNCEGQVLEWCGKRYDSVPAKCGHVELELPPGCYVIRASAHTWWSQGHLYGNWATDRAVVQACCDERHCVTLYAPSVQACWIPLFWFVLPTLIQNGTLPRELEQHLQPLRDAVEKLPITDFEKAEGARLQELFKRLGEGQEGPK